MENRKVLGIDIGGTNLRLGLVSNQKELVRKIKIPTEKLMKAHDFFSALVEEVDQFVVGERIISVAIGVPATVNKERTQVLSAPNIAGLEKIDLVKRLGKKYQVPVYLDRDVNYLLRYDMEALENPEEANVVIGYYVGTGCGNAIYLHGNFYHGKNGVAGELGHIPVYGEAQVCGCGNRGCIELYASGKKLEAIRRECFPETQIQDIFHQHKNSKVMKDYLDWLAIPLATEINILDPDEIIVGGGVISMDGFPRNEFVACVKERSRKPYPAENLSIRFQKPQVYAGVLGAAYFALDQ
jgi:allose kinase